MPVQQITVVPSKEVGSSGGGKSAPRSKDKHEGRKAPKRSGSRSSNVSKASNSTTGITTNSRTSISPSSQDICSNGHLARLEEDVSESLKDDQHTPTSEMTVTSAVLGSSSQAQKKQVKRRHRRKRGSCSALDCVESSGRREQTDRSDRSLSSDRSDRAEKREHPVKPRKELPPRLRCSGAPQSASTSEDEVWRESRSWSKEKARRVHRRSASSRERDGAVKSKEGDDKTEVMELQSVGSDEGKENQPLEEEDGGEREKMRHSSQSIDKEKSCKSQSPESSSAAEDREKLITKTYQEKGSGGGDMAVPVPQTHCGANGGLTRVFSDDSEGEVCRICHCEGDEEFPLIMPCRCTGSLSYVHQACLNQWIKSSDTRCCELCKFDFIMETKLKPLQKWEKLQMTKGERRKIFFSVFFHLIAIVCMLWSVYILVKRTAEEIRLGKDGVLEWPFWTKLIVVAIGFTGGLIFMYIQCKVYLQLWHRLKAFNRIITVQNCPEKDQHHPHTHTNGRHDTEVPVCPAPVQAPQAQVDSDMSVEEAVAPVHNPV